MPRVTRGPQGPATHQNATQRMQVSPMVLCHIWHSCVDTAGALGHLQWHQLSSGSLAKSLQFFLEHKHGRTK